MKYLWYVLLICIAPDIFADLFDADITPNDQSIEYIGTVFGSNIGNIALGGPAKPVLSGIMEKFNIFIVIFGTIIMCYIGLMSTLNTGDDGSAMGKKWSSRWLPLRSVIGMVLMVPSPSSGYSVIQVIVIWIVIQGIGVADSIWKITLDGLHSGASAAAGVVAAKSDLPDALTGLNLAQSVLDAQICMRTFNVAALSKENIDGDTWVHRNGSKIVSFFSNETPEVIPDITSPTPTSASVTGTISFGINDPSQPDYQTICGKMDITGTVLASEYINPPDGATMLQDALKIYLAKRNSVSTMLNILKPLAEGLVVDNGSTKAQFSQPQPGRSQNPAGLKQLAIDSYMAAMSGLIVSDSTNASEKQSAVDEAIAQGLDRGWITAGSFYFILNQTLISKVFKDAKVEIRVDPTSPTCRFNQTLTKTCQTEAYGGNDPFDPDNNDAVSAIGKKLSDLNIKSATDRSNLALYLAEGSVYLNSDTSTVSAPLSFSTGSTDSGGGTLSAILARLSQAGTGAVNAMIDIMSGNKDIDPLLAHSMLGRDIMFSCELAWITIFVLSFGISLAVGYWGILIGLPMWLLGLLATVSAVLGSLWAVGASLAIYTPLIPYMFFTVGAIGWALIVIEAVIAGPLIALGLVIPGGDEMGKIQHAFGLISNLFLRPGLMVIGFLLAGNVYKAAITLVDSGMASVFQTINVNTLFSSVVIMALYVSFVLGITNLCFSLIYALPDKILRWIGGATESTGKAVSQITGQTKSGTESAGSAVGSQAGEGIQAIGNHLLGEVGNKIKSNRAAVTKQKAANQIAQSMKGEFEAASALRNKGNFEAGQLKRTGETAGTAAAKLMKMGMPNHDVINSLQKGGYKLSDLNHPGFSKDDFDKAAAVKGKNTEANLAQNITSTLMTGEGMSRGQTAQALVTSGFHPKVIESAGFSKGEIATATKGAKDFNSAASRMGRGVSGI